MGVWDEKVKEVLKEKEKVETKPWEPVSKTCSPSLKRAGRKLGALRRKCPFRVLHSLYPELASNSCLPPISGPNAESYKDNTTQTPVAHAPAQPPCCLYITQSSAGVLIQFLVKLISHKVEEAMSDTSLLDSNTSREPKKCADIWNPGPNSIF